MAGNITIRCLQSQDTCQNYVLRVHRHRVFATVTKRPATVRRWLYEVRSFHGRRYNRTGLVVGLGVQWRYDRYNAGNEPVATIQLCVGHRCLVFQVRHAWSIPRALSRFLACRSVTFVNVGTGLDKKKLEVHCRLHVAKDVDLRKRAGLGVVSLEEMARRCLGWELGYQELKPPAVGLSDWEASWLDEAQVQYACVDVFASFQLGLTFGVHRARAAGAILN